jgi:hypothetical protein
MRARRVTHYARWPDDLNQVRHRQGLDWAKVGRDEPFARSLRQVIISAQSWVGGVTPGEEQYATVASFWYHRCRTDRSSNDQHWSGARRRGLAVMSPDEDWHLMPGEIQGVEASGWAGRAGARRPKSVDDAYFQSGLRQARARGLLQFVRCRLRGKWL